MRLMTSIFFPWRIFWRTFFLQVICFSVVFTVCLAVSLSLLEMPVSGHWDLFLTLVAGSLVGVWVCSLWVAYRFTAPLTTVMFKARRLAFKKIANTNVKKDDWEVFTEEIGEYYELENALNRIRRKMRKKRDRLAQEREETEALMSAVMDLIVSVDLNEHVTFFNSHFATHFMHSEQTHTSPQLADLFRRDDILDLFTKCLRGGESYKETFRIASLLDDSARYFSLSVSPLRKAKTREVYGALGIFHDVTEHKKAEVIRIEFVGNASHELRTPLTSIKGYIDTLSEDLKAGRFDSAPRFLEIVSRNVNRLIELVNDLLTLSTLESLGDIKREPVNPEVLTHHVLHQLEGQAREKNLMIHYRIGCHEFLADGRKVEQVMVNLLSNAIKYIPSNRRIDIFWEVNQEQSVVLRVADNGPGILKEHHERLFERFYRVDKGRSRDIGGTGLGLAIVKHIMNNHKGSVAVHSEPGKGAEFICTFPQAEA